MKEKNWIQKILDRAILLGKKMAIHEIRQKIFDQEVEGMIINSAIIEEILKEVEDEG